MLSGVNSSALMVPSAFVKSRHKSMTWTFGSPSSFAGEPALLEPEVERGGVDADEEIRALLEQRIADHERGHDELTKQTADLRSLAAAERAPLRSWQWMRYVVAACVLVAISGGVGLVWLNNHPPAIAHVKYVDGDVKIEQNGDSEAAEVDGSLESGQQIIVPRGGAITLAYDDGSEIRLKGDSAVTFGDEQPTAAKRL